MTSASSHLATLPVSVHTQAVTRLSAAELVKFESMLAAADDSIDACMNARSERCTEPSETQAGELLRVAVDTVAALTNTTAPPSFESKSAVVAWISSAVLEMRNREVALAVAAGNTVSLNPAAVGVCMELISKLNSAIGGQA